MNTQLELILLELRPDEIRRQDWRELTDDPRIRISFIEENIDRFPWDANAVAQRSDITLDFIIRHKDKFHGDWYKTDIFYFVPEISVDDIIELSRLDNFIDFKLELLLDYKSLTMDEIKRFRLSGKHLNSAAEGCRDPGTFLAEYPEYWHIGIILWNREITEEIVTKWLSMNDRPVEIIAGPRLSIQFIRSLFGKNVTWISLHIHPDFTMDDYKRQYPPNSMRYTYPQIIAKSNIRILDVLNINDTAYTLLQSNPNATIEFVLLLDMDEWFSRSLIKLMTAETFEMYLPVVGSHRSNYGLIQDISIENFIKYRSSIIHLV